MIKGHTYDEQIYDSYAHRMLNRAFLDFKNGIVRDQGNACDVTYTARNLTVSDGYIIVQGGITEISAEETLEIELDDSYCRLVYEVDMTKTNDDSNFNQGILKILKSSSDYPTLTQEILTKNTGVYQFELAQFKASVSGITDFIDKRSFIDYGDTLDWLKDGLGVSEDTYSNSSTYSVGDLVIYNNKIYICITAITTPENFDSEKWELVPIIKDNNINGKLIKPKILWTNPNISASRFEAQQITLNTDDYDYLEIFYYAFNERRSVQSLKVPKGEDFELMTVFSHNGSMYWGSRVAHYVNDTSLYFDYCMSAGSGNIYPAETNDWLLPIKILGYKY